MSGMIGVFAVANARAGSPSVEAIYGATRRRSSSRTAGSVQRVLVTGRHRIVAWNRT